MGAKSTGMAVIISSDGHSVIGTAITFEIFGFLAILLRFWALRLARRKWASHDTLITVAFVSLLGWKMGCVCQLTSSVKNIDLRYSAHSMYSSECYYRWTRRQCNRTCKHAVESGEFPQGVSQNFTHVILFRAFISEAELIRRPYHLAPIRIPSLLGDCNYRHSFINSQFIPTHFHSHRPM